MKRMQLLNTRTLARKLGLSAAWLKAEANAGEVPCLKVGRRLLFNAAAVEQILLGRAAGSAGPEWRLDHVR